MKILEVFNDLDKIYDSRVRICIMAILTVNSKVDFNAIKKLLNLTDGNLASHIIALERNDYIKVHKIFIGKKPNTSYSITPEGKKTYQAHCNALRHLLKLV